MFRGILNYSSRSAFVRSGTDAGRGLDSLAISTKEMEQIPAMGGQEAQDGVSEPWFKKG